MTDGGARAAAREIEDIFATAGCEGALHAQCLHGDGEFGVRADQPVVLASVMKVLVALEAETRMADGRWDPAERVTLRASGRTRGPAGFSLFDDDVELSLRDLTWPTLTISDNDTTDELMRRSGLDALNATARRLGLTHTVIAADVATTIDSIGRELGFGDWAGAAAWASAGPPAEESRRVDAALPGCAALDPARANRSTPRETTRLLRLLWSDAAGPAAACARVRAAMGRQLTRDRIAAGFRPPVSVAAKSGGLVGVVRNEIGVVSCPGGERYAVSVFTRTAPGAAQAAVNACLGAAAARAVALLRGERATG